MLSLIICSREKDVSPSLRSNIAKKIGADYELIVINNFENKLSIFEAYNLGIEKSNGEFLVFLHDDILFNTEKWGQKINEIFYTHPRLDLLGVAGSKIKTRMPSTWWANDVHIRMIQHHKQGWPTEYKNSGFEGHNLIDVAVIDGVLMILRKDDNIRLNEEMEGFHNYDMDLSLLVHKKGRRICVTNLIEIEHFSGGTINKDWFKSASRFHYLNSKKLPIIINTQLTNRELKIKEFSIGASFVMGLLDYNLKREALYWWFELIKMKLFAKFHIRFIRKFLNK